MKSVSIFLLSTIVVVVAIVFAAALVAAQTTTGTTTRAPVAVTVNCDRASACYPWSALGPRCTSGSRMNLRFATSACPENAQNVSGVQDPVTDITYAFCPRVDELQAFNLTDYYRKTAVYTHDGGLTWQTGTVEKNYLSAIGFGNQTFRTFPLNESEGRVLIIDNTSSSPCDATIGQIAAVSFLVLNVSFKNGAFVYLAGHGQPPGSAFQATCDGGDICTLDATLKCIGDRPGRKMCAKCYATAALLAQETMQIWVSYYGTDTAGRRLRSGASNPLNFREYSLGGVYASLSNAYKNFKTLQLPNQADLNPVGTSLRKVFEWF